MKQGRCTVPSQDREARANLFALKSQLLLFKVIALVNTKLPTKRDDETPPTAATIHHLAQSFEAFISASPQACCRRSLHARASFVSIRRWPLYHQPPGAVQHGSTQGQLNRVGTQRHKHVVRRRRTRTESDARLNGLTTTASTCECHYTYRSRPN